MYTISLRTYISFELLEKRICKVSWLCGLDRLFFCIFLTVYLLLVPNCSFKASRRKKRKKKGRKNILFLLVACGALWVLVEEYFWGEFIYKIQETFEKSRAVQLCTARRRRF